MEAVSIGGSDSPMKHHDTVQLFRGAKGYCVLIFSWVGNAGLNLLCADVVIFTVSICLFTRFRLSWPSLSSHRISRGAPRKNGRSLDRHGINHRWTPWQYIICSCMKWWTLWWQQWHWKKARCWEPSWTVSDKPTWSSKQHYVLTLSPASIWSPLHEFLDKLIPLRSRTMRLLKQRSRRIYRNSKQMSHLWQWCQRSRGNRCCHP